MPIKTAKKKSNSVVRKTASAKPRKKAAKTASPRTPALKFVASKHGRKSAAKKKSSANATSVVPVEKSGGIMWKLLEEKQARQKATQGKPMPSANPFTRIQPQTGSNVFGRFHGPRRRAA